MLLETQSFFSQYDWHNFFLPTAWAPRFPVISDLGILPLLRGTLYISVIALALAVPVGLFTAIYMAGYVSLRFRSLFKRVIEILAGIQTIVYGLFSLIAVGPMLRDYLAKPLGFGSTGRR